MTIPCMRKETRKVGCLTPKADCTLKETFQLSNLVVLGSGTGKTCPTARLQVCHMLL